MRRIFTGYIAPNEEFEVLVARLDDTYLNLKVYDGEFESAFELVGTREQLINLLVGALTKVANTPPEK